MLGGAVAPAKPPLPPPLFTGQESSKRLRELNWRCNGA